MESGDEGEARGVSRGNKGARDSGRGGSGMKEGGRGAGNEGGGRHGSYEDDLEEKTE